MSPLEPDVLEKAPAQVSLWEATRYWLMLGLISFGGPAGQISLMHQQLVEQKKWISEKRFLHALNYCMLLPGPEAQQLATYIGWLMHRTWGGVISGGLFVLPSFLLMLALAYTYSHYGHLPIVSGFFTGIKPVVLALVMFSAYRLGKKTLLKEHLWVLALIAFVAIAVYHTPFPIIVFCAGLYGFAKHRWQHHRASTTSDKSAPSSAHHASKKVKDSGTRALIDDDTPIPAHAKFHWATSIILLSIGVLAMLSVWGLSHVYSPPNSIVSQAVVFFTKAALLTFGGAYAVLPYIYQGMVDQFHWLTPAQVMDGLALGESTPGPLIMVITFLAFLAGMGDTLIDPSVRTMYAFIIASVATLVTFLPSFIFIFMGAPLIESSRTQPALNAPLNAISAAIVGVIASLAVFLAYHLIWPLGFEQSPHYAEMLFTLVAFVLLKTGKINTIYLILLAGAGNATVQTIIG